MVWVYIYISIYIKYLAICLTTAGPSAVPAPTARPWGSPSLAWSGQPAGEGGLRRSWWRSSRGAGQGLSPGHGLESRVSSAGGGERVQSPSRAGFRRASPCCEDSFPQRWQVTCGAGGPGCGGLAQAANEASPARWALGQEGSGGMGAWPRQPARPPQQGGPQGEREAGSWGEGRAAAAVSLEAGCGRGGRL